MAESIVRERALAEEIVQEVMLELWRRRESLEVEQTFRAYLVRSTRNRALNDIRHQRVVAREAATAALDSPSAPSAEEEILGVELERAVRDPGFGYLPGSGDVLPLPDGFADELLGTAAPAERARGAR